MLRIRLESTQFEPAVSIRHSNADDSTSIASSMDSTDSNFQFFGMINLYNSDSFCKRGTKMAHDSIQARFRNVGDSARISYIKLSTASHKASEELKLGEPQDRE